MTTTTGVTGFAADKFVFDTKGFQNDLTGDFSVALTGDHLDLVYTVVPAPRATLLRGLGLLALLLRRRRHA